MPFVPRPVRNPGEGDCWKSLVVQVGGGKEMRTVAVLGPAHRSGESVKRLIEFPF